MRTQTIQNMTLTYPDYLVYAGDNNYLTLEASGGTATLSVSIGNNTQSYASESDFVLIDISALIKYNATYNSAITMTIYIARTNPDASQTITATIYVVRGRTLADRYHASARKILLPYGSTRVELLCDEASTMTGGTSTVTTLAAQIYQYGISGSCNPVVKLDSGTGVPRGWFNDGEVAYQQRYTVEVLDCLPENGAYLRWYDADGCKRYVAGKIMTRTTSAERVSYFEGYNVLKTLASGLLTGMTRTFDFGIAQVEPELHLEEIVFSPEVVLLDDNGLELQVVPDFGELTVSSKDIEDITLSFIAQI